MRWQRPVVGIDVAAGENVRGGEGGGCLDSPEEEDLVRRGDEKDAVTEASWLRLDGFFVWIWLWIVLRIWGFSWRVSVWFDGGVLTWRLGWQLGGA